MSLREKFTQDNLAQEGWYMEDKNQTQVNQNVHTQTPYVVNTHNHFVHKVNSNAHTCRFYQGLKTQIDIRLS